MHEVYIAMELTIYIFNFNPSINKVVYCASKKKRELPEAGFEPALLEPIVHSRCLFHYRSCFICDHYVLSINYFIAGIILI